MRTVRLVTGCGAERLCEAVEDCYEVIVPIFAERTGHADDLKYFKTPEQRMAEDVSHIRRRYFRFAGECDHDGRPIYREVVK